MASPPKKSGGRDVPLPPGLLALSESMLTRLFRLTLGFFFLVLGISGLFLPFLQGLLFLALAALLFSPDLPFLARWLDRLEARHPSLSHPLRRMREFLKKFDRS